MIENILCAALEKLPGMADKVYKVSAPESEKPPYIVLGKHEETEVQDLDGGTGFWTAELEVHLLAKDFDSLKQLERNVKAACRSAEGLAQNGIQVLEMRARTAGTDEALPHLRCEHGELEVQASWREV